MICDLGFVYFSSVHQLQLPQGYWHWGEEEGFCIKKFPQFIEHIFVHRFIEHFVQKSRVQLSSIVKEEGFCIKKFTQFIEHLFVQRFIGHFVQKSSVQLSFIVTINLSSLALICIISRSVIFTSYDTSLSP